MNPRVLLQQHFGFRDFLEGQEPVVRAILEGQDVLVIMLTNGWRQVDGCLSAPANHEVYYAVDGSDSL
jgi:ATP-dependent DNA helicase RecQ